ncbi:MAG TPA: ABC transporter ATP-binding protein [Blastocatellia bacterium]
MSNTAIIANSLGKEFRIGERQAGYRTLREAFSGVIKRRSGDGPRQKVNKMWALHDVSFEIKKGEVIGIIGRNGAGKSTLLKILSRITEPTRGYADITGRVGSLLEVGTGFHPELTGRENIFLNGAILGMKRVEIGRAFDEIVSFAEVDRFIDTAVKHYSSGMYLRLAFAVAAHLNPEILLVDEVLAVGDYAFQSKCLKKMKDVTGEGRTVVFVSHNMGAIHRLCSRCILLDQGEVLTAGPTEDVIQAYISRGLVERAEYLQARNPRKPINLRRVRALAADGQAAHEFRYNQDIKVEIEYEVNQPVSDCGVWIGVRTAGEVWAFGSTDYDGNGSMLDQREPGYFRTTVNIPGSWLNAGRYYVVVGISKYSPQTSIDRVEAIGFTVLDVGTPERVRTGQSREGVLQPLLKWTTLPAADISRLHAETAIEAAI